MKQFITILTVITVTFLVTMVVVIVKFGSFNISNHSDHYITTCNGSVIDEHNEIVTDRIDFSISVNEGFNIFQR